MRPDRGQIIAALLPGLLLALWLGFGMLAIGAALEPAQRATMQETFEPVGALLFGWWALAAAFAGWLSLRFHRRHVQEVARLVDGALLLAGDETVPLLELPQEERGSGPLLAGAINRLAQRSRDLRADMTRHVEEASRKVAQERDQLGALMAELQQSVVVCNMEGRILLYNGRARGLFHRLSAAPQISGGAELIGLGRSIHAVIDPALISHALETVGRRIARAENAVSARFVTTTPAGNLLQVILAPVRAQPVAAELTGFVLLLDDITEEQAAQSRRDRRMTELTEASRGSLANIQTALDMLDYPDLDDAERDEFQNILRNEVDAMGARLSRLTEDASRDLLTRWPLQDMLAADLLNAAAQRIEAETGHAVARGEVDESLWLSVDSFSLTQVLVYLVRRLDEAAPDPAPPFELRLSSTGSWAHLDLIWPSDAGILPLASWQSEAMSDSGGSALTAREVAERHGGELWLEHDRAVGQSFIRFLVPLAAGEHGDEGLPERPEYYNFDLFAGSDQSRELDDQPLDELAFTVFDTETTGLDPTGGDEIIQMGAVRILKGRLLHGESFDQLVDPGRSIPEASIPFHGIEPAMVQGQPRIGEVLPAFHAFAADTVLVGHNVAFDMRFLQLKEAATGLRFDQPVLDTLLLATVAQPHQDSYSMEEIAARLGVKVLARHSAAGDALTTARIFLRLVPMLRQQGIATLREAREAAEKSYYARLKY